MNKDAYARAGVDIARVKAMQRSTADVLGRTFSSRKGRFGAPLMEIGHYAGVIDIGDGKALALHTDGVGTKQQVAVEMRRFDTIGIDCVAMTVNDLVCLGSEPVALLDYIALEKEDETLVSELVKGLAAGAREASAAVVGGETAVMGETVRVFDLVSMGVGVVERDRILDGSGIREGDRVVGIASSGLHSNGYTLARKVLMRDHALGDRVEDLGTTLGDALLTPTRIYVKPILKLLKRHNVHGVAHITGGAFGKLTRLTGGRKLEFSLSLPSPQPIFRMIQREGGLSDLEMLRTFNMGIGMCVVVPRAEAEGVTRFLGRMGFPAAELGLMRRGSGVRVGGLRVAT